MFVLACNAPWACQRCSASQRGALHTTTDYFEYFGPDFKLHPDTRRTEVKNQNTIEYLQKVCACVCVCVCVCGCLCARTRVLFFSKARAARKSQNQGRRICDLTCCRP